MIDTDRYEEYMELDEERLERTGHAWDEMADEWFTDRGWTKSHMAYDTDRGTGTLWVVVDFNDDGSQVWEDTGISAIEADSLLCEGWDEAEYIGYQEWLKEQGDAE
jgi:hypothetical protein